MRALYFLYIRVLSVSVLCVHVFIFLSWFVSVIAAYCVFSLLGQMSGSPYVGFVDGASRSTRNFSSVAWVIYDPHGELVDIQGVCLGCTTNNVTEYSVVIELLAEAINLGIRTLVVNLDSQLVVHQLNGHYSVRDHWILRLYLSVKLLERDFDFITYQHIPRRLNTLTDALANYVLNRNLHNM